MGRVLTECVVRGQRNPLHQSLPKRLKRARIAVGIQPTVLCKKVGLSSGVVKYIEEGGVPRVDVVEKLAMGLGSSPCHIAYGVEVPFVASDTLRSTTLGARLKIARDEAGLSCNALAKLAGISHTAVGNIEAGRVLPGVDVAEDIAKALKVSPCWLAFGESSPDGPKLPPPGRKKKTAVGGDDF